MQKHGDWNSYQKLDGKINNAKCNDMDVITDLNVNLFIMTRVLKKFSN